MNHLRSPRRIIMVLPTWDEGPGPEVSIKTASCTTGHRPVLLSANNFRSGQWHGDAFPFVIRLAQKYGHCRRKSIFTEYLGVYRGIGINKIEIRQRRPIRAVSRSTN